MFQGELFKFHPPKRPAQEPQEFKVVSLRECPTPEQAAEYWRRHILTHPFFDPERECLVVLLLNVRKKLKGHHFVSTGTMESVFASPAI